MSEMQDNKIQEPVAEADGERLRTHTVSISNGTDPLT